MSDDQKSVGRNPERCAGHKRDLFACSVIDIDVLIQIGRFYCFVDLIHDIGVVLAVDAGDLDRIADLQIQFLGQCFWNAARIL